MAAAAAIALLFAQNNAHPTGALIAIFVIIFGFVFVLLRLQRRDVDVAQTRDKLGQLEPAGPVDDPTTVDTNALMVALAVKPIDREAIATASDHVWGFARGSIRSGTILMVLIACAVIPWELWTAYWSLYIFVPIILVYVVYLAYRAIGGQVGQAYDDSAALVAPLGLELVGESPPVFEGERHGRHVRVKIDGSHAITEVAGVVAPFRVKVKGERLHADEPPPGVEEVLSGLRASSYWKGVSAEGGKAGVTVERTHDAGSNWMRDLWLAEHLADAARP